VTETEILNRIDDPGDCRVIITFEYSGINEYCQNPEYHPFSGLCERHAPDGYPYHDRPFYMR
jgi:hypothetical protein